MQRRAQLGADGGPGADVGGQLGGGGRGRGLQRDRDQAMEILSTRRRCWWIGEQEKNDVSILIPLAPSLQLSQADCILSLSQKSMNRPINSLQIAICLWTPIITLSS